MPSAECRVPGVLARAKTRIARKGDAMDGSVEGLPQEDAQQLGGGYCSEAPTQPTQQPADRNVCPSTSDDDRDGLEARPTNETGRRDGGGTEEYPRVREEDFDAPHLKETGKIARKLGLNYDEAWLMAKAGYTENNLPKNPASVRGIIKYLREREKGFPTWVWVSGLIPNSNPDRLEKRSTLR